MTSCSTSVQTDGTYLTTRQLAERLQVSPNTVCRLARQGRIPCHRVGHRTLRFVAAEVDAALRAESRVDRFAESPPHDIDTVIERVVADVRRDARHRR